MLRLCSFVVRLFLLTESIRNVLFHPVLGAGKIPSYPPLIDHYDYFNITTLDAVQKPVTKVHIISPEEAKRLVTYTDGKTIFEYNTEKKIGFGVTSEVYRGLIEVDNKIKEAAFKVAGSVGMNKYLDNEESVYELIGKHASFARCYALFTMPNTDRKVLVTELLGSTLFKILEDLKRDTFSGVTVLRIGLAVFDALKHLHDKNIQQKDVNRGNIAVGYKDKSKIYLFDFGFSIVTETLTTSARLHDLKELATVLLGLAQSCLEYGGVIDQSIDGIAALEKFAREVNNVKSPKCNYMKLRAILNMELEEHKDKPTYKTYEWQAPF